MPIANRFTGQVFQNSSVKIHAKLQDASVQGDLLTHADFGTISYWIRDQKTKETIVDETFLTVADVLADVPDSNGDNFHVTLPETSFPEGDRVYDLVFKLVLADGTTWQHPGELLAYKVPPP